MVRVLYSPRSRTFRKIGIRPPLKNMVKVIARFTSFFPAKRRLRA